MKYTLNLSRSAYVDRRILYAFYAFMAVALLLLLVLNLINLGTSATHFAEIRQRVVQLREQTGGDGGGSASATEIQRMARQITSANELLERDAYRWTALLDQLELHLVEQVGIRSLEPDYKTGILKVSGVAGSVADLRRFLDRLTASEVFENVYLLQQAQTQTDGESDGSIDFSIELKRRGGA